MDHAHQNSSDGGGGRLSRTWPPAGHADAPRDGGGPQARPPPARDPEPEPMDGQQPPPPARAPPPVLSLDQIRITGSSNEYTDAPAHARGSPPAERRRPQSSPAAPQTSGTGGHPETPDERPNNLRNLPSLSQLGNTNSDSRGSLGAGGGGVSPGERHFGDSRIIRTQPKRAELGPDELKPLRADPAPGGGGSKEGCAHLGCKDRGCCCCPGYRCARALPSCDCERRLMCSAQKAVEYATCMCCVKGLFYHCSSDDEDTCSDEPFSCRQPHRCARYAAASLLVLLFPCLLCYLPAKGCVAVCQCCYNLVSG